MNGYGAAIQAHWQRWLPRRYEAIRCPKTYFAILGDEAAAEVWDLADMLYSDSAHAHHGVAEYIRRQEALTQAEDYVLRNAMPDPNLGMGKLRSWS